MINDFPQNIDNSGQTPSSPLGEEFVKEDLPEVERQRKALAAKRTFWVAFGLIVVLVGLLVWEIAELIV